MSKASDRCAPFFEVLKKARNFKWTDECEAAFIQLKEYIGRAPLLTKPKEWEISTIYLGVSQHALSATLVK